MRVLLATSELHPFSKTGGLADMVGALTKYLARAGCRTGVVTPLYAGIRDRFPGLKPEPYGLQIAVGHRVIDANVWTLEIEKGATVYFLDYPPCFDRPGLYGERGRDYTDNAERFVAFARGVTMLAHRLSWRPEVLHLHDWQTGWVPLLVQHAKALGLWRNPPKTCFTIHNLAYQGIFPASAYHLTLLPLHYFDHRGVEYYAGMSSLKAGLVYADWITTVSPRYAQEIMTREFGCGLDGVLRDRQDRVSGILNGVDYEEWQTENNPFLKAAYSANDLRGKAEQKRLVQEEMGLPAVDGAPLFVSVTRLAEQKGIELQIAALQELLEDGESFQFALLGSGDPNYETAFQALAARYPDRVAVRIGYNHGLSHRIEAGGDFFLMPSRFEPCGLNQMYSLRYGTVPIVRATGGLENSVTDARESAERANGIKFNDFTVPALKFAMKKAFAIFHDPQLLAHYRRNGMTADFSWDRTAAEYLEVYKAL